MGGRSQSRKRAPKDLRHFPCVAQTRLTRCSCLVSIPFCGLTENCFAHSAGGLALLRLLLPIPVPQNQQRRGVQFLLSTAKHARDLLSRENYDPLHRSHSSRPKLAPFFTRLSLQHLPFSLQRLRRSGPKQLVAQRHALRLPRLVRG